VIGTAGEWLAASVRYSVRCAIVVVAVCACIWVPQSSAAQVTPQPLPVEAAALAYGFTPVTQIQLSPDGDWVAYTVTDPRRAHMPETSGDQGSFSSTGVFNAALGTELRITHVGTGETHRLRGNDVNAWGPSWSPNGRYLAFYSDASGQVEVWVFVNEEGRVVPDSTHLRPPTGDRRFDEQLAREASGWVFDPAREDGLPIAAWFPYTISM
jgi:WD40 repeat protein